MSARVELQHREGDRAGSISVESRCIQSISLSAASISSLAGRRRAGAGQLEDARAELAEHAADAEELVLGGEGAGHGLAVERALCPIVREVEKPSAPACDALLHDRGHLCDVLGGRGLVVRAALAHHVGADRAVGHLGADVDGERALARARPDTRGRSPSPT